MTFGFENIFYEVAAVVAISAAVGFVAIKLHQPLIVAFIAVGILVGPAALNLVTHEQILYLLAELGITLLLFVVGLKLDVKLIRSMGPVSAATGLGQVAFTSIFGFLIARALGLAPIPALYVAVALTFSSTIIIVKLLTDKGEIDSLHGRIAIGFLIVQDIVVVVALIGLTALGAGDETGLPLSSLLEVFALGLVFIAAIAALARYVLPPLLKSLARSRELLLLFSIAWAVLLAAAGDGLGFSKEVGAFLAGVSLASTAYRDTIANRLTSLRDFLLLFFFINLGAQLELEAFSGQIAPAIILSLFVLIGNPLIVMAIMGRMGYRRRTGFLAGLTVAQISEFSLIFIALGLSLGHIDRETLGLVTMVGLATIGLSTYMILYSYPLYRLLAGPLKVFERKTPYRERESDSPEEEGDVDIIQFGLGRYGENIALELERRGKKIVAVDFDPEILSRECRLGLCARYGDAEDPDVFDNLPLDRARWVVSTIRHRELNLHLLNRLKEKGYSGRVALAAREPEEAEEYLKEGADRVLQPYLEASEQAADTLTASLDEFTERLPENVELQEIGLPLKSAVEGMTIAEIDLRAKTGSSILGVARRGRTIFNPAGDFRLFPRDRLILAGVAAARKRAEEYLLRERDDPEISSEIAVEKIKIEPKSPWAGKTLADLALPRRYGLSVISIERGGESIQSPKPEERLREDDSLTVFGNRSAINRLAGELRGADEEP